MVRAMAAVVEHDGVIDEVLGVWAMALGEDRAAYRGHAYRVFNFARAILASGARDDVLAVTSAFHDLGIWSDRTFDYLAPSIARADAYLRERRPDLPAELVAAAIDNHHKLRKVERDEGGVVEAFRLADRVDLSRGLWRAGLDRGFVKEVVAAFPYAGFHGMLLRRGAAWFVRNPHRPLPMLRL
jgi:hypothetical protein